MSNLNKSEHVNAKKVKENARANSLINFLGIQNDARETIKGSNNISSTGL
jgi:hypothetical protein